MALVPHKITALAESDAQGTDGKNIVAGAVVSLFDTNGTAVTLFDDENGTNGSTAKQTDATGQVVVYVTAGEYDEEVNGSIKRKVTIGGSSPIEAPTFSGLENLRPFKVGQAFICQERANAKYILQPSGYVALPGDVTFANGRVGALQVDDAPYVEHFGGVSSQSLGGADSAFDNKDVFANVIGWCQSSNYSGEIQLGSGYYRTTEPLDFEFIALIKGCGKAESYIHADHLLGPAVRFRSSSSGVVDCGVTASATRRAKAYLYGDTNFGILYEVDDVPEVSSGRNLYSVLQRAYVYGHPDGLVHVVGGAYTGSMKDFELSTTNGHAISFDRGEATGRTNLITGIISGVCNIMNGRISNAAGHAIACGSDTNAFSTPCLRVVMDNLEGGNNATNKSILYYDAPVFLRGSNYSYINSGIDVHGGASVYVAGRNIHLNNNRMLGEYDKGYVIGTYDELPTNGVFINGMSVINPLVAMDPLIEVTLPAGETVEAKNIFVWQGEDANVTSLIGTDATMGSGDYRRVPLLYVNGKRPDSIKSADQTVNNSTTFQDDDDLKVWVSPSEKLSFEFQVEYSGDAAADIKMQPVCGTASAIRFSPSDSSIKVGTGDTATIQGVSTGALTYGASAGARIATISGFVENGATAGWLKLQWAQLTADASDTKVLSGLSKLTVTERKKI